MQRSAGSILTMQIFAYDKRRENVAAAQAKRKTNYFCPECQGIVRLRGGNHRRLHFFHFQDSADCRLGKKSELHLATQLALQKMLAPYPSFLEQPFPQVGRIADCVVPALKLNFEIQCSPITPEEVEARIRDYASCQLTTVWILHEATFNKKRVHPAEQILKKYPHYYTNINEQGQGMIYDQFFIEENNRRRARSSSFPIAVSQPIVTRSTTFRREWPLFFAGDIVNSVAGLSEVKKLNGNLPKKESLFSSEWKKLCAYLLKKLF